MSSARLGIRGVAAAVAVFALPSVARGDDAPAGDPRFGLGWEMGNGLSPLGVDVIFAPVPRLALDVQAGLLLVSNVDGPSLGGVGLAPALRAYLRAEGSSPYLALGGAFRWSTTVWTFGNGGFGNLGYEWRWPSGTRIFLGAGVAWFDPLGLDGGRSFNLELGVGRRGL